MKNDSLGKYNILVTSAGVGTAINVIKSLKSSSRFDLRVYSSDQDPDASGLFLSDHSFLTPNSSSPVFLEKIAKIVSDYKIDFIFPNHSSEILLFSKNLSFFQDLGVGLVLPSVEAVETCSNKKNFLSFLVDNDFSFPKTYSHLDEVSNFPVFIKPVSGSSSSFTFLASSKEKAAAFIDLYEIDFIIQEYIDEEEITADCYVNQNSKLIACVPRRRLKVKDGKSVVGQTLYDQSMIDYISKLLPLYKI